VPGAWPLIAETAEVFELAGLSAEAASLAEEAWNRGGPATLLSRAMRLMLSMGDLDGYEAARDRAVTVSGLDPLASTHDLIIGAIDASRLASERVLSAATEASARISAAWSLFAAARAGGTKAELGQAAARLAELFPGSPEASIALAASSGTGSRVSEMPSPAQFLSAGVTPVDGVVPAVPAAPPAGSTFAVQAGAFQVRENADELVKDLSRAGFQPSIRERAAQGKTVFRVYAATGLDRASADRLLERLGAAGYAGIVVGD
jgi:cell division septation protein DedD